MARSGRTSRHGFTLVEMLVVLAIIGLLAAILVPTIGIAMRTVRQGAIRVEMKNMETAIESYKNKFNDYPVDCFGEYGLPATYRFNLINAHIKNISRRADTSQLANWLTATTLPNPHFNQIAGSPAMRAPRTMMPHEAIVFLLTELSTNVESPLGYAWDGSAWILVDYDPMLNLTGTKHTFFDAKPGQLQDLDGDGWLEYYPSGIDAPYAYFDARIAKLASTTSIAIDFETGVAAPGFPYTATGVLGAGYAQPYWKPSATLADAPPVHDSYQLLSCGVDGNFGDGAPSARGVRIYPPLANSLTTYERDNLANFAESRLDTDATE